MKRNGQNEVEWSRTGWDGVSNCMDVVSDISDFGFELYSKGKVRNIYTVDTDKLLIVATDRISAFDSVFNEGIPNKGAILNQVSKFWFDKTKHITKNHYSILNEGDENELFRKYNVPEKLWLRSMIVKKTSVVPIEAIVRGYLLGSAWKSYKSSGRVNDMPLPDGLKLGDKLDEPLFTPTTKEDKGHDQNITEDEMRRRFGDNVTDRIKEISISLYSFAEEYSHKRGLILADTKFEFGILNDEIILIDEALTPDSSRYLDKTEYDNGNIVHFDKQYLRNYLESIQWDKEPPAPHLPDNVVSETSNRYAELYRILIGREFRV